MIAADVLAGSLVACSGGAEAEPTSAPNAAPTATYVSSQDVDYMSAYPEFTYKQATFRDQSLELYADGTYRLIAVDTMYSGHLTFPDEGEYDAVPRGSTNTTYYGTAEVSEDDGLSTVKLAAPTRAVTVSTFSSGSDPAGLLDTSAWTDEMGTRAAASLRQEGTLAAEDYLDAISFGDTEVLVDLALLQFDFIQPPTASN